MDNKTINRLYTTAGIVLIIIVVLLIVQAFVFIINPLPDTTEEYLELYNASPLLGVLSLGLMYLMHNVFLLVPYLALFFRLKDTNYALVLLSWNSEIAPLTQNPTL